MQQYTQGQEGWWVGVRTSEEQQSLSKRKEEGEEGHSRESSKQ